MQVHLKKMKRSGPLQLMVQLGVKTRSHIRLNVSNGFVMNMMDYREKIEIRFYKCWMGQGVRNYFSSADHKVEC